MKREYSMDIFKGVLVLGMILVHILQFFSNNTVSPSIDYIINYGNIVTFSGFVFCFGYVVQLSYLDKKFKSVYTKLIKNVIKTLLAFYISGIAFKLFIGGNPLTYETFKQVIILNDIPGWSEFLISFAYFNLLTLILFVPFKKLLENKKIFWMVFSLLLLACFMPYGNVKINQIGILIGTKQFACFPVLQYMPFYLVGMYFKKYNITFKPTILLGAFVLSAIPTWKLVTDNVLPDRFPPSLGWIVMPMFILYLYYLLCKFLEIYENFLTPIKLLGQNVLFCLVFSNIFIFTMASNFKGLIFTLYQSIYLEVFILGIIYYFIIIISGSRKSSTALSSYVKKETLL
jgi:hypothetical protein